MIGERLKEIREKLGMNKKEFSEYLNIKYTTYNNYETEAREPASDFLILVSEKFDVSIDYLLGLRNESEILHSYQLKSSEYGMVEKYRYISQNSPSGASIVDTILDREYNVAKQLRDQADMIAEQTERITSLSANRRIFAYYGKIAAAGVSFGFDDVIAGTKEYPETDENINADYTIGVSGDSMEPQYSDGDIVFVKKVDTLDIGDIGIFQKDNGIYIKQVGENGLISLNGRYNPMVNGGDVICLGKVIGKAEE